MEVVRKTSTRPLPANAEIKAGKSPVAVWTSRGKEFRQPVIQVDGQWRLVAKSKKWYGTVAGKLVPLSSDKTVAERMLRKLLGDADAASVGLPVAKAETLSVEDAVEEYRTHLSSKGNTKAYVALAVGRVQALVRGCGFELLTDLHVSSASEWLMRLQKNGDTPTLPKGETFKPSQVAKLLGVSQQNIRQQIVRHGLKASGHGRARVFPRETAMRLLQLSTRGVGPETANHYIRAIRGFSRWLVDTDRMGKDPFRTLKLLNAKVDVRRNRRELTEKELRTLFATVKDSKRTFRGLDGPGRYTLYLVGASTGFRASALASLTPASFSFGETSTVTLAAKDNKSRKLKVQPLPNDVANVVREYVSNRDSRTPIWGGTWARDHRGGMMLRLDLIDAGIAYCTQGVDGPVYADFHALRHSFITQASRAGISLLTVQKLAGHSKPELTARYTHTSAEDMAEAMERMPNLIEEKDSE